jgi:hypothetical protein
MKITFRNLAKLSFCTFALSISVASADTVGVSFREFGFIKPQSGENSSAENSKYVFSGLKFGGACGSVVKKYKNGQTTNNYLPKGLTCTISGVLKRRDGRIVKNSKIEVRNELETVRNTKYTNSKGVFSMSFKVLDNSPNFYTIIGPKEDENGARIGCTIYSRDHAV